MPVVVSPDYDGRQGRIADGKLNSTRIIVRPPACHLYRRHFRPCRDNVTDCPARERKTHGKPRRWYEGHHCMSNTFPANWFQHNRSSSLSHGYTDISYCPDKTDSEGSILIWNDYPHKLQIVTIIQKGSYHYSIQSLIRPFLYSFRMRKLSVRHFQEMSFASRISFGRQCRSSHIWGTALLQSPCCRPDK